jgi:hypothetical protein
LHGHVFNYLFCARVERRRTNITSLSQTTANGVAVTEALDLCNATIERRAMYARVARWRKRLQQAREDEQVAELALLQLQKGEGRGGATPSGSSGGTPRCQTRLGGTPRRRPRSGGTPSSRPRLTGTPGCLRRSGGMPRRLRPRSRCRPRSGGAPRRRPRSVGTPHRLAAGRGWGVRLAAGRG